MQVRLADTAGQGAEQSWSEERLAYLIRSPPAMFKSATSDQTGGLLRKTKG